MRRTLHMLLMFSVACGGAGKSDAEGPDKVPEHEKVRAVHDPSIHDDAEDEEDDTEGFEVEGLAGHLDPYDIERGIQPHSQDLSECFFDRAKKNKYLGGKVEMAYKVGRDGAVKTVQMKESSLGAWQVEKCLLDVARSMSFKKPRGKGDADFTVPLDFTSVRSALWLSDEAGQSEVDEYLGELEECGRARSVYVTLYVAARGKVKSVGFASQNGPLADEWADCAEKKIKAWQLTDPRGKVSKMSFLYNAR